MYDMMNCVSSGRNTDGCIYASARNMGARSASAMDPITLATASRRAEMRRRGGCVPVGGVRTTGERRCACR